MAPESIDRGREPGRRRPLRGAPASPRFGIWGIFDLGRFESVVMPRVLEHELRRRLPQASIRLFSPLGAGAPIPLDALRPAEGLGPWSPERIEELAAELDCVVATGDVLDVRDERYAALYGIGEEEALALAPSRYFLEGLGERSEVPLVWSAVGVPAELPDAELARIRAAADRHRRVTVCDPVSQRRLRAAGLQADPAIVPDPAFLLQRVFEPDVLDKRRRFMELVGWLPADGGALLLQGDRSLAAFAPALARAAAECAADAGLAIVLLTLDSSGEDRRFADDVAASLGATPVHRVPAEASPEDVVAAIRRAAVFVGTSSQAAIAASCYGVPQVLLNLDGRASLDGLAALLDEEEVVARTPADVGAALARARARERRENDLARLQLALDAHFDEIAGIAESAALARAGESRGARGQSDPGPLLEALAAQARRTTRERTGFVDVYESSRRRLEAERDEAREELRRAVGEHALVHEENRALRQQLDETLARARAAEQHVDALHRSRSFRLTRPLRTVGSRLRRR